MCVPSTHPTTLGNPETYILHVRLFLTFMMFLHLPQIFDLRKKINKMIRSKIDRAVAFENESRIIHQELLFTQTILQLTIYIID